MSRRWLPNITFERTAGIHALAAAFTIHSGRLESILDGTWTTSSELIGELGVAVVAIRKKCKHLTPAHEALLKECLRQVRKVWPGFGLLNWLSFR